jgi:hypothetical protein
VDVNRASQKPQDDKANKEKLQLMKERIPGGKYMEVEIYVKHGLLNDGGLGLLRFKMFLSHIVKHTSSVIKVKSQEKL